ncbi:Uncharacterised protein [Mycobacteroides abscessus subsp. abscessus]|nr:Uncharacterised protein [Mycobacteroides abscessus subsp. abscessus]
MRRWPSGMAAPISTRGPTSPGSSDLWRCCSVPRRACTRRIRARSPRCSPTSRPPTIRTRRSTRSAVSTPRSRPTSCIPRTSPSSSACAGPRASRSTSCPSSTKTFDGGGAATRCGRPTMHATARTPSASSPDRSRSRVSPVSMSRWASCSIDSRPRSSTISPPRAPTPT